MLSRALRFWIGKTLFGDDFLARFAISWDKLDGHLAGKNVAIVGNARSLAKGCHGAEIDSFDIVIRLNDAPMPSHRSHGTRTDWLAAAKAVDPRLLAERQPAVLLWMPTKRRRLTLAMVEGAIFYLNPPDGNVALRTKLLAPPSLGYMMVDLLSRSQVEKARLFGFDFFASHSLSGSRTASQVPHDFAAEARGIQSLLEKDSRFSLAPTPV